MTPISTETITTSELARKILNSIPKFSQEEMSNTGLEFMLIDGDMLTLTLTDNDQTEADIVTNCPVTPQDVQRCINLLKTKEDTCLMQFETAGVTKTVRFARIGPRV